MAVQLIPYPANSLPSAGAAMSQPTGNQAAGHAASPFLTASSEVLVAAVIFLFIVVVFVFFLYLYAKHYWVPERHHAHFVFAASGLSLGPIPHRGLDAAVLEALPVTIFRSADFEEEGGLECSVCLSEVSEGEEVRILPKCSHGFHLQCIDMWFHSHSTCPLCRNPVGGPCSQSPNPAVTPPPTEAAVGASRETESSPVFPANMLFWGNQDQVSSSAGPSNSSAPKTEGMLVIEIPSRVMMEGFQSPLPTSRFPGAEEMKTPTSASSRMKTLRRMLSRGKRTAGSSGCSPRGATDIEQGEKSAAHTPRTPTNL